MLKSEFIISKKSWILAKMDDKLAKVKSLPPKYKIFADGLIEHGNGRKAAIDAGYAEKSASVAASRVKKNGKIEAYLAQVNAISSERAGVTQEYVISNLKEMVERCMQKAKVLDKKGEQIWIETPQGDIVPAYTFNSAGAAKGLELLGKHLGTFDKDKVGDGERPAFVGISINMGEGTVTLA